jgi:universal stress protein A
MSLYQHVLAAVETHDEDGPRVLRHAKAIADSCHAALSVVHVVEYLPVDPAGDALLATPVDLTHERRERAHERIEQWCAEEGISPAGLWVNIGSITREIMRARDESSADLIVIGHHSRRGLAALFSSTDDGVLHRAPCDVLAVHLG